GPSSNVMTTSCSLSGRVCLYCILPIPLNSLGLIVSTRLVPSAFGFPGQASDDVQADPLVRAREMTRKKNPAKRIRTRRPAFIPRPLANSQSEGRTNLTFD